MLTKYRDLAARIHAVGSVGGLQLREVESAVSRANRTFRKHETLFNQLDFGVRRDDAWYPLS
jgi:hypothetical protein